MSAMQDIAPQSIGREVTKVIAGVAATDGAGVELTRVIGSPQLSMLDPFLLLDRFSSDEPDDYIAGFPPHPHRGFETVTYLLHGRMRHKDSAGHEGVIEGRAMIGGYVLEGEQLAVLNHGEAVTVAAGDEGACFLLVAGRPLQEPVARGGPFVMNIRVEIQQEGDRIRLRVDRRR